MNFLNSDRVIEDDKVAAAVINDNAVKKDVNNEKTQDADADVDADADADEKKRMADEERFKLEMQRNNDEEETKRQYKIKSILWPLGLIILIANYFSAKTFIYNFNRSSFDENCWSLAMILSTYFWQHFFFYHLYQMEMYGIEPEDNLYKKQMKYLNRIYKEYIHLSVILQLLTIISNWFWLLNPIVAGRLFYMLIDGHNGKPTSHIIDTVKHKIDQHEIREFILSRVPDKEQRQRLRDENVYI